MKANLRKISKYFLIGLIAVACVYVLRPGFAQYSKSTRNIQELEAEIEKLEAERARLQELEQKLEEEDPELVEKLAREKLQLSKPGETIFKFDEEQ